MLLDKVYNSLKLTSQNFLVNCVSMSVYCHLNQEFKVLFKFNQYGDLKEIKYRYLTGPEKVILFKNINIPSTFLDLHNKDNIQHLWKTFFKLINDINE